MAGADKVDDPMSITNEGMSVEEIAETLSLLSSVDEMVGHVPTEIKNLLVAVLTTEYPARVSLAILREIHK